MDEDWTIRTDTLSCGCQGPSCATWLLVCNDVVWGEGLTAGSAGSTAQCSYRIPRMNSAQGAEHIFHVDNRAAKTLAETLERGNNNFDLIRLLAALAVMFGHSFGI